MKKHALAIAMTAALLSGCSAMSSSHNNTESTPYTLKSGGEIAPYQKGLSVSHARLNFSFDFAHEVLFGDTTLTLNSDNPQTHLSVDLDTRFTITSVWLNGKPLTAGEYRNEQGELIVESNTVITYPATLRIVYQGHPRTPVRAPWDGGVMWEQTPDGEPWLATAVQGEGCDLFWPCIDQPFGEPATADIFITVPNNLVAAANGVLTDTKENGDSKTWHWHTRSMHNTYGIALNIAPYEILEDNFTSIYGNTIPLVYYHLKGNDDKARALFNELPGMITFFERMIGPYPFSDEKAGIVQTPHLGMEHQTINAYGNDYKKDETGYDWLMQHEFSHEWFGNQLTNDNWDHMWLHEGLGSYMQPLYAQYLNGDLSYFALLNNQRKGLINEHPIVNNKLMSEEDVYESGPAGDIYAKGSLIMHTLRYLIGDEAFFRAVTTTVYGRPDPAPGNFKPVFADTQTFIDNVNAATDTNMDWFFDVYLYHAPLPELITTRDDNGVTFTWKTENDLPFPMPLDVSIDGKVATIDMVKTRRVPAHPKDTVIADPHSKVLRYEQRYEDFKAWKAEQAEKEETK